MPVVSRGKYKRPYQLRQVTDAHGIAVTDPKWVAYHWRGARDKDAEDLRARGCLVEVRSEKEEFSDRG